MVKPVYAGSTTIMASDLLFQILDSLSEPNWSNDPKTDTNIGDSDS